MRWPAYGTTDHMPFKGHRNQRQVREDEERQEILDSLGKDAPAKKAAA